MACGLQQMLDSQRLAKRGLPHPAAWHLCDQAVESIQHILVNCVFSGQVWILILQSLGLFSTLPDHITRVFSSWWSRAAKKVEKELVGGQEQWKGWERMSKRGLNPMIILSGGSSGMSRYGTRTSSLIVLFWLLVKCMHAWLASLTLLLVSYMKQPTYTDYLAFTSCN